MFRKEIGKRLAAIGLCITTLMAAIPAYAAPTYDSGSPTPGVPGLSDTYANPATGTQYQYTLKLYSGAGRDAAATVEFDDQEFQYNGTVHGLFDKASPVLHITSAEGTGEISPSRFEQTFAVFSTRAAGTAEVNATSHTGVYGTAPDGIPKATHVDEQVFAVIKLHDTQGLFEDLYCGPYQVRITPVELQAVWDDTAIGKNWGEADPALTFKLEPVSSGIGTTPFTGTAVEGSPNTYKFSVIGANDIQLAATREAGEDIGTHTMSIPESGEHHYLAGTEITTHGDYSITRPRDVFTISRGILDNVVVRNETAVYDKEKHYLDTEGLEAEPGNPDKFKKVEYSTDGINWSEDKPYAVDANGDGLPVYIRVTAQNDEVMNLNDLLNGGEPWIIKIMKSAVELIARDMTWNKSVETVLPTKADMNIVEPGLAGEDVITYDAGFSAAGVTTIDDLVPGRTYTNSLTFSNIDIRGKKSDGSQGSVLDNYTVSAIPGSLTATDPDYEKLSSFTFTGYRGEYDGEEHYATVKLPRGINVDRVKLEYKKKSDSMWRDYHDDDIRAMNVADSAKYQVRATIAGSEPVVKEADMTVAKKALTLTAPTFNRQTGQDKPDAAEIYAQMVITGNNVDDPIEGTDYTATLSSSADMSKSGTYPITVQFLRGSQTPWTNYNITTNNGSLIVASPAADKLKKITVTTYSGTYDGAEHKVITAQNNVPTGAVLEYSLDGVDYSTTVPQVKDVTFDSTGKVATNPVYIRATLDGTTLDIKQSYTGTGSNYAYKITRTAASIKAKAASKTEGDPDPEFTAEVSGLKGKDTFDYTVVRTNDDEKAGTYNNVLKPELNADYPNYSITLTKNAFTINKPQAYYDIQKFEAEGYSGTYDGSGHSVKITKAVTGATVEYSTDNGSTWSTSSPKIKNVKDSTSVWVRATKNGYDKTVKTSITINKKSATVEADDKTKKQGESTPSLTATVSGTVGGDRIDYSLNCSSSDTVGTHSGAIKVSLNGDYPNYSITLRSGTLTVESNGNNNNNNNNNTPNRTTDVTEKDGPGTTKKTTETTTKDTTPKDTEKKETTKKTTTKKTTDKDDVVEEERKDKFNDLIDHDKYLITGPDEDLDVKLARFVVPEDSQDPVLYKAAEEETVSGNGAEPGGDIRETGSAIPYIAGAAVAAVIAVTMGVTGAWNLLWLLLLGLLFAKKRKKWHGLLTYENNMLVKVKGDTEGVEDMQDIINKGVTVDELQTLMVDTGVMTILPAKTMMALDIEGQEVQEIEADEDKFYDIMREGHGHAIVNIFNGKCKFSMTVEMDLKGEPPVMSAMAAPQEMPESPVEPEVFEEQGTDGQV